MNLDRLTHQFYERLQDVLWRDLPVNTGISYHFQYYYAEDRLYIFKDKSSGAMFFQEAKRKKLLLPNSSMENPATYQTIWRQPPSIPHALGTLTTEVTEESMFKSPATEATMATS